MWVLVGVTVANLGCGRSAAPVAAAGTAAPPDVAATVPAAGAAPAASAPAASAPALAAPSSASATAPPPDRSGAVAPLAGAPFVEAEALAALPALGPALLALRHEPPSQGLRSALLRDVDAAERALALALWLDDRNVRLSAAQLVTVVDPQRAVVAAALRRSLRHEPDRDVRAAVAAALIGRRAPGLAADLAAVLHGDSARRVRANAAWALGTSADAGTVAALVRALADEDATVRLGAVASLRRLRARDQVAALRRLRHDRDARVRRAAAAACRDLAGAPEGR